MISKFCDGLLVTAAERWPAEVRAEMLAEWRAELHSERSPWRRILYAASLVLSPPARQLKTSVVAAGASLAGSVLAILLLPVLYMPIAVRWITVFSADTVPGQVAIGAAGVAGAILLGIICANGTTGVTQLIKPHMAPLWTFGVAYLGGLTWMTVLAGGVPIKADLIDFSCWALAAAVLSTGTVWLALAGRKVLARLGVAASVLISFWFWNMHSALSHLDDMGMGHFFAESWAAGFAFAVLITPALHVTIFLTIYAYRLAGKGSLAMVAVTAPA